MQVPQVYPCAYCGEPNDAVFDLAGGRDQTYVEDCAVCCRPNLLSIHYDADTGEVTISARRES